MIRLILSALGLLAMASPTTAQSQLWGQQVTFFGGGHVASVKWPNPITDREAVDDFDVVGSVTSLEVAGQVCYQCATPSVLGVWVRFYDWTPSGPGSLVTQTYFPANSPNLAFGPLSVAVTLPTPFVSQGRNFLGVQVESSNASGWGWGMTDAASVQLGLAQMRDSIAGGGWVNATATNALTGRDLAFVLSGTPVVPTLPPAAADPCGPFTILQPPIPSNATGMGIAGIRAFAPNDLWAVGNLQLPQQLWGSVDPTWIARWDGNAWTRYPSPVLVQTASSRITLTAIGGSSSNDIWVVGSHRFTSAYVPSGATNPSRPLAMHFDGSNWQVFSPLSSTFVLPVEFNDVLVSGPNDAWIVGDAASCGLPQAGSMRWDGSTLTPVPTISCSTPVVNTQGWAYGAITSAAPGEYWAVGAGAGGGHYTPTTLITRFDGSQWNYVPGPTPGSMRALGAVASIPGQAWAAGAYYDNNSNTNKTFVIRHDGVSWTQVSDPPIDALDIAVLPSGRAVLVGTGMAYWDGAAWIRSETFSNLGTPVVGSIDVMGQCAVAVSGSITGTGTGTLPFVAYQDGGCFARPFGAGLNSSLLQLDFVPTSSPDTGNVRISGASPLSIGILAVSNMPDLLATGLGTILVSLDPANYAALINVPFGSIGTFAFPLDLHEPGLSGLIACAQAAAVTPAGTGLSAGLQLGFCP